MSSEELTGRTLGDFVVRHRIGEGGFGAVYRAEQPALGREAVIKALHGRHRSSKTVIQRFLREARLASKLDHPYAAHIYSFGVETDGVMWIAMEYVRGQTLHDLLRSKGPLPLEELVPLLDRICEVLQAAHDLGIVHRDIKPPNVMVVSRSGRAFPKLLDFGIAKLSADEPPTGEHKAVTTPPPITPTSAAPLPAADTYPDRANPTVSFVGAPGGALAAMEPPGAVESDDRPEFTMYQAPETPEYDGAALTEVGATVGSPPYMAPEQWQDAAAASTRTDLYALGILTYEALTNRRPFGGATVMAIAYAHQEDPVPPLGGTFPLALDDVMATVLAKKPTDRYQTALEFAQAFRAAAGFGSQPLPAFDDDLRASVEASLPQPIAEAVAAYQAANNPHQGRDALRDIVTTSLRLIAMLALAAYAQVRPAGTTFNPLISDALRELRRRGLRDDQWLELARELVAPFQERPETHPLPELVRVLRGGAGDVLAVVVERRIADPDPLATIRELLPQVTRMLRAFAFLADYTLVVSADGRAEAWMGVRRPRRVAVEITARTLDAGQPTLVDGGGRPTIVLYPLIQTRSPMPGAPPELFMLDGRGRRGARLVALPQTLERQDETVWDWIGEKFAERDRDTPVSLTGDVGKPYRGLAAFTAEDAEVFVGREREIDAALNRLKTAALVAVVGPSGAGKSSFVHAGIVPSLPEGWTTVSVRPGTTPLATLQSRLRRAGVAITELGPQPGETTTAIVVDQFEELFTLGAPDDERRDYVRLLLAAADSDKLRVVITLRDDFLARATQMPELRDRLPQALFLLGTPARADLVRILKQPLARRGFDFEDPSLPEKMVDDVADAPGALALLSFTASKLWDLRDRHFRQLTRKAYDALGGVAGALARHAEATLAELSHSEQRLARTTFRHLVSAEGTRAVLTRGELAQLMRDPNAGAVVEKLIAARLLVSTESETGGDDRIEIIHEALLAAWPRLAEWRREDADGARLRDQVRAAARQWNERKQPRGLLWRDDAVAELKLWRARHPQPLTDGEEAFVTASLAESTRVHRMRRLVIGGVILTLAIAVAVLFWARSSVSKVAARDHARVVAELVERGRRAVLSGDSIGARAALAEARRLGADDTSLLRFLEHGAAEPIAARLTTLTGHSALVDSVEFSPSGAEVLTASTDGTANLWDVSRSAVRVTLSGCRGALLSAHYEPSGKHIATECDDGHVRLYSSAGSLEHVLAVGGTRSAVKERPFTRFSPDGERLATDLFGVLEVWDVATGERVWGLDPALRQTRIAFSPDGATLATLSGKAAVATLWNASTGERVRELALDVAEWTPYNIARSAIAFSPDGTRLVTIANDADVAQIWNVATGAVVARIESRGGAFTHLVISPDGQHVVTASRDHSLQIWSLQGHLVHALTPVASQLADLVVAPSSTMIGGAFSDGSVILWNMDSGTQIAELQGHDGPVWSLAFDRGVDRLVTGGSDTKAMVWNLQSPTTTHVVPIGAAAVEGELRGNYLLTANDKATVIDVGTATVVARVPIGDGADARFIDDHRIAIVDRHGTISVWTIATNEVRRIAKHRGQGDWVVTDGREHIAAFSGVELIVTDTTHELYRLTVPATITTVAFAPDGGVIIGDVGGNITRIDGAERTRVLAHTSRTRQLFVLSDGRIVSASNNVVQLWTPDGALLHTFMHASGDVTHITIDHAGRKLASASLDATVRIWDLNTYEEIVSIAQPSYADWPTFSPDDDFLATTSDQGTVRVWDAQTGKQLAQLQALPSSMLQISDTAIIAIDRLTIIFPR